jgi:hypothetical protein
MKKPLPDGLRGLAARDALTKTEPLPTISQEVEAILAAFRDMRTHIDDLDVRINKLLETPQDK